MLEYFFPFAIAVVALIGAVRSFNQVSELRERIAALEAARTMAAPGVAPPPLPQQEPPRAAPAAAETVATTTEAAPPIAPEAGPQPASAIASPPPPLPETEPGFEERIGTRWVVWVGGLTLALGGFFMVRYSIEAGLLGPGVRTLLGRAFALALLAAGEWTRRKESS